MKSPKRARSRVAAQGEDAPGEKPLYEEILSILSRHDPLGFARPSLPIEALAMFPATIRTGMEPADQMVRPPRSAVERLTPSHGSDLASAPNEAKRGIRQLEREPARPDAAAQAKHLQLRRDYGRVYNDALAILSRHDPKLARFGGASALEYQAEASAILPRLGDVSSEGDVRRVLEEEFARLIGRQSTTERDSPTSATWEDIGSEVWEAVRKERGLRR